MERHVDIIYIYIHILWYTHNIYIYIYVHIYNIYICWSFWVLNTACFLHSFFKGYAACQDVPNAPALKLQMSPDVPMVAFEQVCFHYSKSLGRWNWRISTRNMWRLWEKHAYDTQKMIKHVEIMGKSGWIQGNHWAGQSRTACGSFIIAYFISPT